VNTFVERHWCPEQCFERHGSRNVRGSPQSECILYRQRGHGSMGLRAIDERDPFLGAKRDRRQPERAKHVRGVTGA
jgi:hypothetical protein